MSTRQKLLLAVIASSTLLLGCSTPRHSEHWEYKTVTLSNRPAADARPWRADNPLPVPTERETYVLGQELPVYRVLYERNDTPLPELAVLEQWLEATPEPTDNPLEPAVPTA